MASKPEITPRLVIIEGKDKGKVIPLKDGSAVIGRSKGDVLIQDPRVSRSHVALNFDARTGKLTFTDLKSLNGTLVNNEARETGELHDGDKLQLGNTLFDCQLAPTSEIHPPEPRREKDSSPSKTEAEPSSPADTDGSEPVDSPVGLEPEPSAESKSEPSDLRPPHRKAPETQAVSAALQNGEPRARFKLPGMSLTPRTRKLTLAALAAILLVLFFGRDGNNATLLKDIAEIKQLESQRKIDEAMKKTAALAKRYPENPELQLLLGDLFSAKRKYQPAIAAYLKAHELKPTPPLVHLRLVRAYLMAGLGESAQEEWRHFDELVRSGVHSKELFVEAAALSLDFKELKRPPEETIIMAKALQNDLAPESPIGYKLEAQMLFQQNRADEAVAVLEKGLAIDPTDEWLLENIAFAKLSANDVAGARLTVDSWLKAHPENTKAHLVMAYLMFHDKDPGGALPHVQKILEIAAARHNQDPHFPEALDLMGQILQTQGKNDEALAYYKQGCEAGFQGSCEKLGIKQPPGQAPGAPPATAQAAQPSTAPATDTSKTAAGNPPAGNNAPGTDPASMAVNPNPGVSANPNPSVPSPPPSPGPDPASLKPATNVAIPPPASAPPPHPASPDGAPVTPPAFQPPAPPATEPLAPPPTKSE